MSIQTAGQLRGFLADVLIDIRAKRIAPDEASAIAKVAGEINRSLAVEVATALQAGVKKPVPGSMVIASTAELLGNSEELLSDTPTELPKIITQNIPKADVIDPSKVMPIPKRGDNDKIWCEQCDMRVTVGQAVGCKSPHCKAKEAA